MSLFRKILVANRGEIAVRIIRACQELGIATVAVYSEADAAALHTSLADEAVCIGPPPPLQSYLQAETLLAVAREHGCDAVHPGYGFLAENADFAAAVAAVGLTFIGPSAAAMRAMGGKIPSRQVMEAAGVPVVPGYHPVAVEPAEQTVELAAAAERLGYPILIKATAGGGGKGMRIVTDPARLAVELESARREAQNAFGDPTVYLEKLIPDPRHIEFQILADHYGHVIHLGERECSIQRRHQKIIEETPSPALTPELRARMGAAAVAAAQAVGYTNAGTVEFLLAPDGRFYFLEMNTRLQVEHPITEAVTGIDLVKAQIRIAAGQPLPWRQEAITWRGHAIEARIYAEDPANQFLPATGRVLLLSAPVGPGIRVDTGIMAGDVVGLYYDPMIAKLICWAENRDEAVRKLDWALAHYLIAGVTTNIPYLQAIVRHPAYRRGELSTDFVARHLAAWQPPLAEPSDEVLVAAAVADFQGDGVTPMAGAIQPGGEPYSPWRVADGFRLGGG